MYRNGAGRGLAQTAQRTLVTEFYILTFMAPNYI